MKVKDAIEQLSSFDPDMELAYRDPNFGDEYTLYDLDMPLFVQGKDKILVHIPQIDALDDS